MRYLYFFIFLFLLACQEAVSQEQIETFNETTSRLSDENIRIYKRLKKNVMETGGRTLDKEWLKTAKRVLELRKLQMLTMTDNKISKNKVREYLKDYYRILSEVEGRPMDYSEIEKIHYRINKLLYEEMSTINSYLILLNILKLENIAVDHMFDRVGSPC